jgi:hypothetical protein
VTVSDTPRTDAIDAYVQSDEFMLANTSAYHMMRALCMDMERQLGTSAAVAAALPLVIEWCEQEADASFNNAMASLWRQRAKMLRGISTIAAQRLGSLSGDSET